MKRTTVIFGAALLVGGITGTAQYLTRDTADLQVTTAALTRGTIVDVVSATGTLEAVTTVEVGTQVSGTVKELLADFNQSVEKGQVLARLEPSLFAAQVEQARANVARADADVQGLQVSREDALVKLQRARRLSQKQLIAATDLESAEVAVRSADAELASARASATQARAGLNQSQVNLEHTVIRSPIDGIVVSRNVDVGQTVAASMSAPTLYVLAADLTQMQVNTSVDESDVGRVRTGQSVRFRVDAYPEREFDGTVGQVRLNPTTEQNVVTYTAVVSAANPEMLLKPGMTANITIELARRSNVLIAPAASVRFKPTEAMFSALGQAPPSGTPASVARVWLFVNGKLRAVPVAAGLSNGAQLEIQKPDAALSEGTWVVTGASLGGSSTSSTSRSSGSAIQSPFEPPRPPGASSSRGR